MRISTLILIALAILAAPAQANEPYPLRGLAPASDGLLLYAAQTADLAARDLGYSMACPLRVWMYDDPGDPVAARGDQPGCNVYIARHHLAMVRNLLATGNRNANYDHRATLCALLVHERLHNAGLDHEQMGNMLSPFPRRCMDWARAEVAAIMAPIDRARASRRAARLAKRRAYQRRLDRRYRPDPHPSARRAHERPAR